MATNVFPDNLATSIRRDHNGGVKKINRWTGKNLRHSAKKIASPA